MKRYYITGIRLVKSLGRGYDEAVVEAVLQYPFYEKVTCNPYQTTGGVL